MVDLYGQTVSTSYTVCSRHAVTVAIKNNIINKCPSSDGKNNGDFMSHHISISLHAATGLFGDFMTLSVDCAMPDPRDTHLVHQRVLSICIAEKSYKRTLSCRKRYIIL